MRIEFCDACGLRVGSWNGRVRPTAEFAYRLPVVVGGIELTRDCELCLGCFEVLKAWVTSFLDVYVNGRFPESTI